MNLQTKAPYIADSVFRQNGFGINQGSDSSPHIKGCTFTRNTTGIGLWSGKPLISENTFTANSIAVGGGANSVSSPIANPNSPVIQKNLMTNNGAAISFAATQTNGGGAPIITGNTLTHQTSSIITIAGAVTLRDNRITENAGGVVISNLSTVDFQHNLIANNGMNTPCGMPSCADVNSAVFLDISSNSGSSPSRPSLAYNPDKNEYLVVWAEGTNQTVKAQRLSADGALLGTAVQIAPGQNPVAAYNSANHEYLVVYYEMPGATVSGQRLSDTLGLLASPILLTAGFTNIYTTLRVVYQSDDSLYLVVWRGIPSGGGADGLYAQYVHGDGALLNGPMVVGSLAPATTVFEVAYDRSDCEAACPGRPGPTP